MHDERPAARLHRALWLLPAATLAFHLATLHGYGYFRDELYYLACGRHLDFGYVDHPPLIGLVAAAVRALAGESLPAIRFLPAVAAATTVWLAMAIARALGGSPFAQLLAGLATALCPVYVALFGILSMNAFDILIWAALFWLAARLLAGADPRLWLAFGAVAGIGLENKVSVLFLGFGLVVGSILARRWDVLRSRWLWLGGGLALLLFLPHLLWQQAHSWPTLEFMANARRHKMAELGALDFAGEQILNAGPVALPLWIGGLGWLLLARAGRPFRALGWAYLVMLVTMTASGSKPYYLGPAYTVLFAAGGVAAAGWLRTPRFASALRPVAAGTLLAGGLLVAPLAKPLLPVDLYVRYAAAAGIAPSTDERHELARLPQFFADMHGWPELAAAVAAVHRALPEADRARACVFGQNYGEAGAIDLFGPAYGLPPAISGHNSYHLWGPGQCTGEVVIVIDDDRETLEGLFASVAHAATFTCRDCMPYENGSPIWVARGLKPAIAELWPRVKKYI